MKKSKESCQSCPNKIKMEKEDITHKIIGGGCKISGNQSSWCQESSRKGNAVKNAGTS